MTDWVRLWHDMPTDPKWRVIARKSGQPLACVIAVFNLLMVSASQNTDDRGALQSWDDEDAAAALDMDPEAVTAILSAMQGKVLEGQRLTGWEKRQPKREDGSAAERKAAWKAREEAKKNALERTGTLGNAPETDAETDTDSEKKDNYAFFGRVIRLKPSDFNQWAASYPALDLAAVLQSRDDWLATQPEPDRKKWFNSTSNWLSRKQQESKTAASSPAAMPVC